MRQIKENQTPVKSKSFELTSINQSINRKNKRQRLINQTQNQSINGPNEVSSIWSSIHIFHKVTKELGRIGMKNEIYSGRADLMQKTYRNHFWWFQNEAFAGPSRRCIAMRGVVAIPVSFSKTTRDKKENFNCHFTAIERTKKVVARRSVDFLFRNPHRLFVEIFFFFFFFIPFHGGKVEMSTRKKEKTYCGS